MRPAGDVLISGMSTKVIYRVFKKGGDVIALFPTIAATTNPNMCQSYQHIGQHGAASYSHVMQMTRPAKPEDYEKLNKELIAVGYKDLRPMLKSPYSDYLERYKQIYK